MKILESNSDAPKNLNFNEFINILKINSQQSVIINKKSNTANVPKKKKDLLEENIKAFDQKGSYLYEKNGEEITKIRNKKTKIIDKIELNTENAYGVNKDKINFNIEDQFIKRNYQDENYFVELIKRNFDN